MKIHKYIPILPIELEEEAYNIVRSEIDKFWIDKDILDHHQGIRNELVGLLNKKGVQLQHQKIEIDKDLKDLIRKICNFFNTEPILSRILFFVQTQPEDLATRQLIHDYIHVEELEPYHGLFQLELFKGQRLLKLHGEYLNSVPLRATLIGKMFDDLLWDFEHYRIIDHIKCMGIEDLVEDLREKRIYRDGGETVFDYSPLFRRSFGPKGVTIEILDDEIYNLMEGHDEIKEIRAEEDEALCELIKNSQADPRENIYFGQDETMADYNLNILHRGKSEKYPIQLLPRYFGYLNWKVRKYSLTRIEETISRNKTKPDEPKDHTNLDELQEGMVGLLKGSRNWDREKGPVAPFLKNSIAWELGHAFERVSADQLMDKGLASEKHEHPEKEKHEVPNRVLLETMDSSGGRLNDTYINDEGKEEEKIDLITREMQEAAAVAEEKKIQSLIDLDRFKQAFPNTYKELLTLLEKRNQEEQLDVNERKRLSRAIKKAKEFFK